jgi:1,4-alpha-glucan branching enzyme
MIAKTPAKRGGTTKVTFEVPGDQANGSSKVYLCGDFNEWSQDGTPMTRRKDGRFTATVTLSQGGSYRFKYLLEGDRWENDPEADLYVDNGFGSKDSVVVT